MTLHIFNPEHDLALAANLSNFTAPHAGRQLRHDLGWLPALWADEGDAVLVDDVEQARLAFTHFLKTKRLKPSFRGSFIPKRVFGQHLLRSIDRIAPWGWDLALRAQLLRCGLRPEQLPSDAQLSAVRLLSNRHLAAQLLPLLRLPGTIGEAFECSDMNGLALLLQRYGRLVLKAPWSSSGRGIRFVDAERVPLALHAGWIKNILSAQVNVMAEPYYHKVKDFAMEFSAHPDGTVSYAGLSLFHTKNGAYTGNVLATENYKREQIGDLLSLDLLDEVARRICHETEHLFQGAYTGPFGVDMMVVRHEDQLLLHPCVEVNLRRTMGHVALALSKLVNPTADDDVVRAMRIEFPDRYMLKINKL